MAAKKKTPAKRGKGQPPKRTPDLDEELLEEIANGGTILQFAKRKGMSRTTVYSWLKDLVLLEQFARARELGALHHEDEILEIADNGTDDDVQHRKLRIYAREQRLVWNNPRKYGKHSNVDVSDKREAPEMTDLERATRVRQLLAKVGVKVVEVEIGEVQPEETDHE